MVAFRRTYRFPWVARVVTAHCEFPTFAALGDHLKHSSNFEIEYLNQSLPLHAASQSST